MSIAARTSDPNPGLMSPSLDSGDHIHPNPTGYAATGNSIELAIFENVAEWAGARRAVKTDDDGAPL